MAKCGIYPSILSEQLGNMIARADCDQDAFNSSTMSAFKSVELDLQAIQKQFDAQGSKLGDNATDIAQLQKDVQQLQNSTSQLQTSFSNLQSDNGTFKANVSAQVAAFQATIDAFQGDLTAQQKNIQSNTARISALETKIDPDLWKKMSDAFNSLSSTVSDAVSKGIAQYDADTVQPALAVERQARADGDTTNANNIAKAEANIAELAETVAEGLDVGVQTAARLGREIKTVSEREAAWDKRMWEQHKSLEHTLNVRIDSVVAKEAADVADLKTDFDKAYQAVGIEQNRAEGVEGELRNDLNQAKLDGKKYTDAETNRAKLSEEALRQLVAAEKNERIAQDKVLAEKIDANRTQEQEDVKNLQTNINAETNARVENVKDLNQRIDDVTATATNAVNTANQTEADAKGISDTLVKMQKEIDAIPIVPKPLSVEYVAGVDLSIATSQFDRSGKTQQLITLFSDLFINMANFLTRFDTVEKRLTGDEATLQQNSNAIDKQQATINDHTSRLTAQQKLIQQNYCVGGDAVSGADGTVTITAPDFFASVRSVVASVNGNGGGGYVINHSQNGLSITFKVYNNDNIEAQNISFNYILVGSLND